MKLVRLDPEQFLDRFDVFVVLADRVLKVRFVVIDDLRPLRLICASINPPFIFLVSITKTPNRDKTR